MIKLVVLLVWVVVRFVFFVLWVAPGLVTVRALYVLLIG